MNVGEILILFTFRDPTSHVVTVSEVFKRYSIAGVKLQVYISLHIPCIIINPYKLSWAGGCRCRCKVSVLSRYRRNHKLFEHFKNKAAPPLHRPDTTPCYTLFSRNVPVRKCCFSTFSRRKLHFLPGSGW